MFRTFKSIITGTKIVYWYNGHKFPAFFACLIQLRNTIALARNKS